MTTKFHNLFFCLTLIWLFACTAKDQKPNVVFILTDQWRASAFGYAGDVNVQTPNLDKLAGEAVSFKNAVSVCPVCTPYRASLLTGKYPTSTGMFLNDLYLPEEELCMAEIFKSAGYNTAYLGKWHLDGHGRFKNVQPERRQGFDYWKALECSHEYNNMAYYENDSPEIKYWDGYSPFAISKEAQNYIDEHAQDENPFLLFVSIAAPHFPHHSAPEEYKALYPEDAIKVSPNVPAELHARIKKELNGYYAHCTAVDKAIGDLLDKLEKADVMENTIVVFTSDHGEMMGSHGNRPKSKQVAWDESTRVPFLIKTPFNTDDGEVVNAPITTPDILPTLLGLANVDIPQTIEGENISELVKSPDSEVDRSVLFMNVCPFGNEYKFDEYRGIRTKQYTYVSSPEGAIMLFDDIKDPEQLNNLANKEEFAKVQQSLTKKLQKELKEIGDENFQKREYYLDKWNLKLNEGKVVDYSGFTRGEGVVQSPRLSTK
ncbi:sulfatase family protein [Saccharicrinis sp. 156]|uniref:sulfatase family protein n=1 Tax=Saccharicrinis sp. 156 TaxID=3417574 RepID=UPI003D34A239